MAETSAIRAATPSAGGAVDWKTWLLWVGVCAICPLFALGFFLTLNMPVPRSTAEGWRMLAGFAGSLTALVVVQWAVLRRVAPRLPLLLWFASLVFAGIGSFLWAATEAELFGTLYTVQRSLRITQVGPAAVGEAVLSAGEWTGFLLAVTLAGAAIASLPAWVLASCSDISMWRFLAAATVGACAAAVMQRLYTGGLTTQFISAFGEVPGTLPRTSEVLLRCAFGAMWGAASSLTFVLLRGQSANSADRSLSASRDAAVLLVLVATIALSPLALP